jgi:hypothetical protein
MLIDSYLRPGLFHFTDVVKDYLKKIIIWWGLFFDNMKLFFLSSFAWSFQKKMQRTVELKS